VTRDLLAQAEAMIAAGGHRDLELHARVDNLAAIAFYEKAGWTATDRLIHTVEHGISYDERILIKRRT
jgi:ribosomal protein S18 acetylase RimI-like enzyme